MVANYEVNDGRSKMVGYAINIKTLERHLTNYKEVFFYSNNSCWRFIYYSWGNNGLHIQKTLRYLVSFFR